MKVLLLGSTGMLGQALFNKLQEEHFAVITSSRANSDYDIDFLIDSQKIKEVIMKEKPDVVINSVALINLNYCESNPGEAYIINSRLPALIAEACKMAGSYFVQISTDHYYSNDKNLAHSEDYEVILLNEYARTKFAGEGFALSSNNSLVVRTNIVGFRNKLDSPTFVEWIIHSLKSNKEIVGFEDFYTSSIDVNTFSSILIELIQNRSTGLINVSSLEPISKYEFIYSLALLFGKERYVKIGSLNSIEGVKRANSLGLDVTKLSSILKTNRIPSSKEVIENIFKQYKEGAFHEL